MNTQSVQKKSICNEIDFFSMLCFCCVFVVFLLYIGCILVGVTLAQGCQYYYQKSVVVNHRTNHSSPVTF